MPELEVGSSPEPREGSLLELKLNNDIDVKQVVDWTGAGFGPDHAVQEREIPRLCVTLVGTPSE